TSRCTRRPSRHSLRTRSVCTTCMATQWNGWKTASHRRMSQFLLTVPRSHPPSSCVLPDHWPGCRGRMHVITACFGVVTGGIPEDLFDRVHATGLLHPAEPLQRIEAVLLASALLGTSSSRSAGEQPPYEIVEGVERIRQREAADRTRV